MINTTRIQKRIRLITFPKVHWRVPEIVERSGTTGRTAVVVAMLRLLYPHQTAVHDDEHRDAEENHDAGCRAAAEPLLVDHRLPGIDGQGDSVERRAFHHEHDVEDAERIEGPENQCDEERRFEQWQSDLPELLPLVRTIDGRRLIDVAGNDL